MRKIAVITGATSGIGLATAKLFSDNGYKVYGIARKPYDGTDFTCYSADVCDVAAIEEILRDISGNDGGIDVLVNNAGMGIAGAVEEASVENIRRIVDVNLTALCVLCSKAIKYLRPGSVIINVSSVGGIMPLPYQAMYSATKAGVEVFSRALSNELKPRKIKVCAVLPGDTATGFTSARICEGSSERAAKSVAKMAADELKGVTPLTVAKVIYKAARKKNPPLRVAVGFGSKFVLFLSRLFSVKFINRILYKLYG